MTRSSVLVLAIVWSGLALGCHLSAAAAAASLERLSDAETGIQDGPSNITQVGRLVYFKVAADGPYGTELWKTDGTAAGTVIVRDIEPGRGGSNPSWLTKAGRLLYFRAEDGRHGYELWRTDGTQAGTKMVRDIYPGSRDSSPQNLTVVGDALFFFANDGKHGNELWRTDGTAGGTRLVRDIRTGLRGSRGPGEDPTYEASAGRETASFRAAFYFSAYTERHGYELWRSDGTRRGTSVLKDIVPGSAPSGPVFLTPVGSLLYFRAADRHGLDLWKTDGTRAGTNFVEDSGRTLNSAIFALTRVGRTLLYRSRQNFLWRSQGTARTTAPLRKIRFSGITAVAGIGYVLGTDDGGPTIWKTDGTRSGTKPLVRLNRTRFRPGGSLRAARDGLYLVASDETHEDEVCYVNLRTLQIEMVTDGLRPDGSSSLPDDLTPVGRSLYFTASDGIHGRELWRYQPD